MKKIKILHIIKSLGRGGAEMLLPETLKLHDQSKFEFHYIYFLPWKDQMVDPLKREGGNVICFPGKNNLDMLQSTSAVVRYSQQNGIDVIHSHLPWSGFIARIVHFKTRLPVIYTEHNVQERYHAITKRLNKISFNFQNLALGVSEDVTRSIKENINPKIPVQTLLNGVNVDNFKKNISEGNRIRNEYGIPLNALVVGNIAVFREQKCIPDWLKAFKKINRKYPEVYGLLVGAGPREEEIKNIIKELHLTERVFLTGLQTDTVPFFSAMDIFMMSSAFEGLPVALLEAMSMSCAVVSTKAGGVVEAVRHGKDGFLCEVGDPESLGKEALYLIENKTQLEYFQSAARMRVIESFSLKGMVSNLEDIYLKFSKKRAKDWKEN